MTAIKTGLMAFQEAMNKRKEINYA